MILAETNAFDVGVALCALGGVVFGSINAYRASRRAGQARDEATAVNRAVNNRPEGEPSLYEMVRAQGLKLDNLTVTQTRQGEHLEELGTRVARVEGRLGRPPWWRRG